MYKKKSVTNRFDELKKVDIDAQFIRNVKLGFLERFITVIARSIRAILP